MLDVIIDVEMIVVSVSQKRGNGKLFHHGQLGTDPQPLDDSIHRLCEIGKVEEGIRSKFRKFPDKRPRFPEQFTFPGTPKDAT